MNIEMIRAFARQTDCQETKNELGNPLFEFTTTELCQFAELIIEECCAALNPMLRDMISRGQGVELIRKQFGIEE